LKLGLDFVKIRLNTFSVKRPFGQVLYYRSVSMNVNIFHNYNKLLI